MLASVNLKGRRFFITLSACPVFCALCFGGFYFLLYTLLTLNLLRGKHMNHLVSTGVPEGLVEVFFNSKEG